ncbi:MAG: DUF58 domain-containing protein, partial [Chloroflexi bacterium]|nr:DUF58 domain-containing protein [Chloroflexota bacterium]
VGGAELLWTRTCLTGVEYERRLSTSRAQWGDSVDLSVRIANRKLLPLTWLQTEDRVPEQLPIERATIVRGPLGSVFVYLKNLLPMLPYEQVTRHYTVRCVRRGLYEFGPAEVESGDLLGYASRAIRQEGVDRLLIYPKMLDLGMAAPQSHRITGRQAIPRVILPDPSRTIGVRSYQPGDPLRHVDWRSSARSRDLLVRVFEPAADPALAIFVNFRVPGFGYGNYDRPELELVVSLAASLARWGLMRGYPVGVFGNGARGAMGGVRIPVAGDPEQLRRILEVLALATPFGQTTIAQVVAAEAARLPFEASLVLITAGFDQHLLAAIDEAARRRPMSIWYVQPPNAPAVDLPRHQAITIPFTEDWLDLEHLELAA